jgi:SAM-dependent methyltransferase
MKKKRNKTDFQSQEFYSKIYAEEWLHGDSKEIAEYLLNKISSIKLKQKGIFLDAGCGIGTLGKALKDRYGGEVHGIEINPKAVFEAKKNGIRAKIGDLEKVWPYPNDYFDTVISVQVIEHVVHTDQFIKEACRVLKKGGLFIVTTPNLAAWFNRIIFLFGYQPFFLEVSTEDKTLGLKFTRKITKNRQPLGHVRGFTLHALRDILEFHRFRMEKTMGGEVNYLPKVMSKIDKIFSHLPSLATDLIVVAKKI